MNQIEIDIPERITQIAKVCHEANRAYCASIGDYSQPAWDDAPAWQTHSAMSGVNFHLKNPDAGPSSSHLAWSVEKRKDGWCYGAVKDIDRKLHPCLVPFNELPLDQKMKDYIFCGIVSSMRDGFTE